MNCVVLGAGLMGRLLAHALAAAGHRVSVHEAAGEDGTGAAARVAASMLAPLAESAITEWPVVDMGHYSLQQWPDLIAQLPGPVFFQQLGTVLLWHRQDALQARLLVDKLHINSRLLPPDCKPQVLDADLLQALEPELSNKFQQGLWLPSEGQLDNRQLLAALLNAMQALHIDIHWHSAKSLEDLTALHRYGADWVFDCRGTGAANEWPGLRGVRGEVIRLHAPQVHITRPVRLMHPRYPLYIAPKQEHVFVIGATEIESDDTSPASVRSTLELLSAAYSLHSGFAEARILEINTQLRPALQHNLPGIRRIDQRCLQINGLYRHGFLIAPAMLHAVLGLVQGDTSLAERFQLLTDD
ncbi:MAG: FAD-dependent oxidoreductase [Limnohabitans sp.]|nr:FAD-dependent oxidoreductase [Limnohabitans sp.]